MLPPLGATTDWLKLNGMNSDVYGMGFHHINNKMLWHVTAKLKWLELRVGSTIGFRKLQSSC